MVIHLQDKSCSYEHLQKNTSLFAYHIGNLDSFFFPSCTWYGTLEDKTLADIVLVYRGPSTPTVLALSMTSAMPQLIQAIKNDLPDRFFCHYQKELEHEFVSSYRMTPFGTHLKMDFHGFPSDLSSSNVQDCIQLTHGDETQLRKLYQIAYPKNYFNPQMLATEKYYGIKKDGDIMSVAGVHVYSRTYRVAVLGNVTTHPSMRNHGLAKRCVVSLLKTLEHEVDFIGLNVKADNHPAIALYHAIGFKITSMYEEALFQRYSH